MYNLSQLLHCELLRLCFFLVCKAGVICQLNFFFFFYLIVNLKQPSGTVHETSSVQTVSSLTSS